MCLSHGKFSSPQEVPKSPTQPLRLRAQTEPSQLRGNVENFNQEPWRIYRNYMGSCIYIYIYVYIYILLTLTKT